MACGNHETVDHRIHAAEARGSFLHRCGVTLRTWSERARQRHALAALDDRLLRDIGVTREAAERECATPFWRRSGGKGRGRFFPGSTGITAALRYLSGR